MKVWLLLAVFLRLSSKERILQPSTQCEIYRRDDRGLYKYSKLSRQASSLLYIQLQLYTTGHITDHMDEQWSAHIQCTMANFHSCCVNFFFFHLRLVRTTAQMEHFSKGIQVHSGSQSNAENAYGFPLSFHSFSSCIVRPIQTIQRLHYII